jgi:large subunit ribosomal protein L35e
MTKGIHPREYRKKSPEDLLTDLKKLREELQNIRFTKVSGTAVAKLSKIKILRRGIARVLTIINEQRKNTVISNARVRTREETGENNAVKKVESRIKNLKAKHLPFDVRPKRTRAIRRRLTKAQQKLVTVRQLKKKLNFPKRKFAVPLH